MHIADQAGHFALLGPPRQDREGAHGGQVRLPFIGGIIAPDQGFVPKYTAGMYKNKETVMIVNRGLGNSIIPQRIFNRPEIVEVVLKKE